MDQTTIKDEWYKDFFSGLNCEMWVKAVPDDWTQREVDFLIATLQVQPGASLLDIQCGYGRHLIELTKRGYHLTGIDISAEFLTMLAKRANAEGVPVQVMQGDVLTTRIEASFDGAYCLGNGFGYVDYEGMSTFVQNVAATLKPTARFVINSGLVAESILTHFPTTNQYELGDLVMDIRNGYVVDEGYMATEITYTKDGRSETHQFKHYVYTLAEIRRLLARHGLRTVAVYNSTEQGAYQLGDQQIYLVAEKE